MQPSTTGFARTKRTPASTVSGEIAFRDGAAILFSSHVTETVERLCDRIVLLHAGAVARTMTRLEWGASPDTHSALEGLFLDLARGVNR